MPFVRLSFPAFAIAIAIGGLRLPCASASEPTPTMLATLRVSDNQRFLTTDSGDPFFYLGDTAWELFHRLDREEAELYLEDRAAKGFNVIQAVALAEQDGLHSPNPYGHRPLLEDDPARPSVVEGPENDYWDHVDWVIDRAASLGLYMGLLPTWGDKWNLKWGRGPVVFDPENAEWYGRWIANRYKNRPIIWILGGDRPIENEEHLEIIRAMARGIRSVVGDAQLITFHPSGWQSSSEWLHEEDWLDFNMFQSGHSNRYQPNYQFNETNWDLEPIKPTLDGEPRYEDIDIGFKQENGRFTDWDVRQAAWWSLLSGACGHTYGNSHVWQMWAPGREPVLNADLPWFEAIHQPGAAQMQHLRRFAERNRFWEWVPDQTLVAGPNPDGPDHIRAARSTDGSLAVLYIPRGRPVWVDRSRLTGKNITFRWFNPRTGDEQRGGVLDAGDDSIASPQSGDTMDWVLVLETTRGT